ncbi:hypothetical protein CSAL01_13101 [Colletotrichum salicis]|uniref:Uncharacterized protein n=1 Tax=Colletotrichum salicis TaxID=1209931 RepID=A0A135U368_9PEZI|nr:hypothetical protein CSAL01_13101 [Colletotrichum salicis]
MCPHPAQGAPLARKTSMRLSGRPKKNTAVDLLGFILLTTPGRRIGGDVDTTSPHLTPHFTFAPGRPRANKLAAQWLVRLPSSSAHSMMAGVTPARRHPSRSAPTRPAETSAGTVGDACARPAGHHHE